MGSNDSIGQMGAFEIPFNKKITLYCIASNEMGWEHVSIRVDNAGRCPLWKEMSFIKNLFWDKEDLVVQFHPPEDGYVDDHKYVLHLWRKVNSNDFCEMPPVILV